MPGIFGHIKISEGASHLAAMQDALVEGRPYTYDRAFEDRNIAASRVHTGIIGMKTSPVEEEGTCVWIEGECYNLAASIGKTGIKANDFPSFLLHAYKVGQLSEALAQIDGYFSAAIYDSSKHKLYLITDRLGMRALYFYCKNQHFAWAGEIKQLLALPFADKSIDPTTAPCFMELGYLLEDHTWFEHIKLTHPASIYTYDLASGEFDHSYYWKWSDIKQQDISFTEARDTLCDLLPKTVEKRFNTNERIGLGLSGGLDSRFLFAAVNELYPDYRGYAYTFGRPDSGDVQIAKRVAELGHWEHEILDINQTDWFNERKPMVWRTEGMLSMMHMHGGEFLEKLARKIDIALNGYAGDVVVGGGYTNEHNADKRINSELAAKFYKGQIHLAQLENDFYDIPHYEPHLYMNRVRRFTNVGTINLLPFISHRKAFMDNDLMEFMFSITDTYKQGNKLYAAALLKRYPAYFKDIPWQKTGKTVDKPKGNKMVKRILTRAERTLSQFGIGRFKSDFTDYDRWIRQSDVAEQLRDLLSPEGSEYAKLLPGLNVRKDALEPHLNNKLVSRPDRILRAAAMEIYLRKVFRG